MASGKGVAAERGNRSAGRSRPGWLPGVEGNAEGPIVDRDSLPPDDAFEILRNPRRRDALRILAERGDAAELTELASAIAAVENEKPPDDVTAAERKRVYISLYQCHVSKMDEAGVVEYDPETRLVELTPYGFELADVLEALAGEESGRSGASPVISAVAIGLSALSFAGSMSGVAMLFLGVALSFAATSVLGDAP